MTGKEVVKLLEKLGWRLHHIHGSHYIMKRNQQTIVVPVHGNRDLGLGLLKKLKRTAESNDRVSGSFSSDEGNTIAVEFPDLTGCLTFGDNWDHAKAMAREALSGYLSSLLNRGIDIPEPNKRQPKRSDDRTRKLGSLRPAPSPGAQTAGAELGRCRRPTRSQVPGLPEARRSRAQQPTLKTIAKLEEVLGTKLLAM